MRFRSRVVQWTRHSRSRSCWIPNATARALIRTRAIAESEMLTTSTPGVAQESGRLDRPLDPDAPRRVDLDRHDEAAGGEQLGQAGRWRCLPGGREAACRFRDGCPRWTAGDLRRGAGGGSGQWRGLGANAPGVLADGVESRPHRRRVRRRRAAAATDDAGAGGQHPRRDGPEVVRAGGVEKRPSRRCDSPAFGMIERSGSPSAGRPIASRASRQAAGPAPQLTPIASAPAPASASAADFGLLPSARTSSSPNVNEAMTGTSDARRASSTASTSWPRSENVSRTMTSAPPSRRPSICSRNVARAAASGMSGRPRVGGPSGPIEPPTSASRPLTSRASRAS